MTDTSVADSLLVECKYAEAIEAYKAILNSGETPWMNSIHAKIASAYLGLNSPYEALPHAKWAISHGPTSGENHFILGAVYGALYRYPEALAESLLAEQLNPKHPSALWNASMFYMALGDYASGLKYYDNGFMAGARSRRFLYEGATPKQLYNANIVVYTEQGAGDTFMLSRYLKLLKTKFGANRVILDTIEELVPLYFNHAYVDEVYRRPANYHMPYDFDVCISLWDIPRLVLETYHIEPSEVHESKDDVAIDNSLLEAVKPYIEGLSCGNFKLGVCWAGNPLHTNDNNRSSSVEKFVYPLLDIPNSCIFNLQYGEKLEHPGIIDLGHELANWAITGAYVSQMDLIVTVDTGVAHLAGVLGVPTIVVCPFSAEWRWGYQPNAQGWKSLWYDSIEVYRQTVFGDWDSIIPTVVDSVREKVKCHKIIQPGLPFNR